MLTLNKYLRELGINEQSWPFREIIANTKEFNSGGDNYDGRYVHQAPLKNGTIDENFVNAETWNMDMTLAMIIYSYLCYFREHCADHFTPGCFCYTKYPKERKDSHKKWLTTLDKMILGFKLYIEEDDTSGLCGDDLKQHYKRRSRKINYGMKLFIKYFDCLGW